MRFLYLGVSRRSNHFLLGRPAHTYRYCYEPCPENLLSLYDFIETAGGDMVKFIHANLEKIEFRTSQLWLPDQGTNKGQQPGGKSHYTNPNDDDDGDDGGSGGSSSGPPEALSAARRDNSELSRLIAGFAARAHLTSDLSTQPLPVVRNAASPGTAPVVSKQMDLVAKKTLLHEMHKSNGMPLGTTIMMAFAALIVGIAFQNQRAWAEMSSSRYSRMEYSHLM